LPVPWSLWGAPEILEALDGFAARSGGRNRAAGAFQS